MTTRTVTIEGAHAWLVTYSGPEDIGPDAMPEKMLGALVFTAADSSYYRKEGYVPAGTATIALELVDGEQLVANKVDALRAEKAKVLGDAELAAVNIERKIQKLLALDCDQSLKKAEPAPSGEDDFPF